MNRIGLYALPVSLPLVLAWLLGCASTVAKPAAVPTEAPSPTPCVATTLEIEIPAAGGTRSLMLDGSLAWREATAQGFALCVWVPINPGAHVWEVDTTFSATPLASGSFTATCGVTHVGRCQ